MTANFSKKDIDIINFIRRFQNFIGGLSTKCLTIMSVIENTSSTKPSEPEFYGDLVYKFRKIIGTNDLSCHFKKTFVRYKKDWL